MRSVTLEEIHRDPAVPNRALEKSNPVEILNRGKVAGTLIPPVTRVARFSAGGFPISKGPAPFGTAIHPLSSSS
jgi:hypothetical protein